jgi:Holliday junction DNA helicase RuvA
MIGYLQGKVTYLLADHAFLEVQGVGYRLFISDATRRELRLNEEARLFTYLSVREDALQLYGFATQREYDTFQLLISVSGIGPKVALGILSHITLDGLCRAIQNKQTTILTKLPGIGKKSAERLVLELKDKVSYTGDEEELVLVSEDEVADDKIAEAQAALVSLGYTQAEITPALKKAAKGKDTAEIIKLALNFLSRA